MKWLFIDNLNCSVFPFAEQILILDSKKQVAIEDNDEWIRIDGIKASDETSFGLLMAEVKKLAVSRGIGKIIFCDVLSDELYQFFHRYGFRKTNDPENHRIHYLQLEI